MDNEISCDKHAPPSPCTQGEGGGEGAFFMPVESLQLRQGVSRFRNSQSFFWQYITKCTLSPTLSLSTWRGRKAFVKMGGVLLALGGLCALIGCASSHSDAPKPVAMSVIPNSPDH